MLLRECREKFIRVYNVQIQLYYGFACPEFLRCILHRMFFRISIWLMFKKNDSGTSMQKLEGWKEMGSYPGISSVASLTCHSLSLGEKYHPIAPKYDLLRETSWYMSYFRYFEDCEIYVDPFRKINSTYRFRPKKRLLWVLVCQWAITYQEGKGHLAIWKITSRMFVVSMIHPYYVLGRSDYGSHLHVLVSTLIYKRCQGFQSKQTCHWVHLSGLQT